ncbi:MAG: lytic murein transglycosylase, partial [Solirubrobacterales bacterium]
MKRTLTLAIALGTTLAVVAAGSASSVTVDLSSGVTVHVPTGGILPACSDGIDNDGDALIDYPADPGCSEPLDNDEYDPPVGGGGTGGGGQTTTPTTPTAPTPPTTPSFKPKPKTPTGGVAGPKGKGKGKGSQKQQKPANRNPDGTPTDANPTLSVATFGPAPIGVPNFIIDRFEIPPFLLPIYQACGTQYGIPWQVLASINRIETAFGTNLNVSSAGAVGWMQFLPSTWQSYGVDANNDGRKDPYNPVDAICAAARYLQAAGGSEDLRQGIFAYNHADWYVDEVLLYAKQYGNLPDDLIGSLTGLTEGAHFPVAAKARYADDISEREALERSKTNRLKTGNAADVIRNSPTRRGLNIYSKVNAPVVAVNDGVIKQIGQNPTLGKFIVLQDAYGNRYTYAELGDVAQQYPVPKPHALTAKDFQLVRPKGDDKPDAPASAGNNNSAGIDSARADSGSAEPQPVPADSGSAAPAAPAKSEPVDTEQLRARIFGDGSGQSAPAAPAEDGTDLGGELNQLLGKKVPGYETFKNTFGGVFEYDRKTMELKPLKAGSKVTGGTLLGHIGRSETAVAPHVHFSIRPAGRGAPKIDPKPILDGWKLLEST